MTTYTKNVSEPWFSLIKLGLKTIEGRLNTGDFSRMKVNDIIIFQNKEFNFVRKYKTVIKKIYYYDTFKEYLEDKKLERCLPGIDDIEDGLSIYYKYYSKEDENKHKIVAIKIKVIQ